MNEKEPICPMIESIKVRILADDPAPYISLIGEARLELAFHKLEELPAWLPVLAGANPDNWPEAVDEVRRWIKAEDEPPALHPGDAKGAGLVEVVLGLGLIAAAALLAWTLFWSWFTSTPQYADMATETGAAIEAVSAPVDQSQSHAVERHGEQAQAVYDALEANCGPEGTWHNAETNRDANYVRLPDGKFGCQIVNCDTGCEVTAFPNKSTTLEDFFRYLFGRGYSPK